MKATLEATFRVMALYGFAIVIYSYSAGGFDFSWLADVTKMSRSEAVTGFVLVYTALQVAKLKVSRSS